MVSLVAWLTLMADIVVSGTSNCPSPQMVSTALAESFADEGVAGSLRVDASPSGTLLSYTDDSGAVRTRVLPPQGSCEEQATRTLVVLASWLAAPQGPALPPIAVELPPAPPLPPAPIHTWRLGIGPLLGTDTKGVSFGGRFDVSWRSSAHWLCWRAQTLAMAPREGDIAKWFTGGAGASALLHLWQNERMQWSADAGPFVSVFTARGHKIDRPEGDVAFGLAGNLGTRLAWMLDGFGVFIDARAFVWPDPPALRVDTSAGVIVHRLPHATLQIGLGVAFEL